MLVLSRGEDEEIMIGDDIKIVITGYYRQGNKIKARIGIEAPKNIAVHRKEIYDRIQKEKDHGC